MNRAITITFVLFLLSAGLASAQGDAPTVSAIVQALRSHDNARALQLSKQLARTHPSDPRVWTLQGIALEGLGQSQAGLQAFHHALKLDPNNLPALEAAAEAEFRAGSPKAEPLLDRLIRLNPQNQTAHAMRASIAYEQKDCATAVSQFQKSAQAISGNSGALAEFGSCLFQRARFAESVPVFQRIFKLQPDDWHSRYNLGLVEFRSKQYVQAIKTLEPLTQGTAARAGALNLIAAVYEANQQTPQAVAALERAIALAPREVDNYLDLATLCLRHQAYKVGIDVVNAGLCVYPRSAVLHLERGALQAQLGHFEQADGDFEKAEDLNHHQDFSLVALGISLIQQNKLDQSLRVVKQHLAKAPNDAVLNYLVSEIDIRRGVEPGTRDFQDAVAAAKRALASRPDFALAADNLAALYLRSSQTHLAEEASRRALKADPNDRTATYHLIECLRREHKTQEVPQLLQRMAKINSIDRQHREFRNRFKLKEAATSSSAQPAN